MLCRVVHADTFRNISPFDIGVVSGPFMDYLIHYIRIVHSNNMPFDDHKGDSQSYLKGLHGVVVNQFLEGPTGGTSFPDRFIRLFWSEPETSPFRPSEFFDRMRDYFSVIQDMDDEAEMIYRRTVNEKARWTDSMVAMKLAHDRRVVFTARSVAGTLLGLGPIHVKAGDEVWVLDGLRAPVVLRPLAGGKWEFLGESYVHSTMYGEACEWGLKKRDVLLA